MTAPDILTRSHATAIRTPGEPVYAVIGRDVHAAYRALIAARCDAAFGPVSELADELEREWRPGYAKKAAD